MGVSLTITVKGIHESIAGVRRMREAAPRAQEIEIRALGDKHLALLREATPIGRGEAHSPRLRDNYQVDYRFGGSTVGYTIRNDAPYLPIVLKGRPGVRAKGRALRFVIDGRVIFRTSVGPAKANRFDQRVRQQIQPLARQANVNIKTRIVRAYGGGS